MSEVRLAEKRVEIARRIRDRIAASVELIEAKLDSKVGELADAEQALAESKAELDRQVTAGQSRARRGNAEFLPTP